MDHRELAELALDRDIGNLKTSEPGYTIGIGESGIRKNLSDLNIGLPEWNFPRDNIPAKDGEVSLIHCYHLVKGT